MEERSYNFWLKNLLSLIIEPRFKLRFTTWHFIVLLIGAFLVDAKGEDSQWSSQYSGLPNSPIHHITNVMAFTSSFKPFFPRTSSISSPFRILQTSFLSNGKPRGVTKFSSKNMSSSSSLLSGSMEKGITLSKLIKLPLKFISNAKPYKLVIMKPKIFKLGKIKMIGQ
ncbi:uncharacterized protein LOC143257947 [Tachypleus tridentatus]|uniref:uncharacterized protein LOC143257947 n=1 Tax=Tachypleus tridentatus TaxID=6853 RepID=UPI003FD14C87